jgi:hypothetical protein
MRFDLPLTAFALESAGAAARALGGCHTLTLPVASNHDASSSQMALPVETDEQGDGLCIRISGDAPSTLTITF